MNDNAPATEAARAAAAGEGTKTPPRSYDPHFWRLQMLQAFTIAKLAAIVPTGAMLAAIDAGTPGARPEDLEVLGQLHGIAELGRRLAAEAKAAGQRPARPRPIDAAVAEGC